MFVSVSVVDIWAPRRSFKDQTRAFVLLQTKLRSPGIPSNSLSVWIENLDRTGRGQGGGERQVDQWRLLARWKLSVTR